MVVRQCFFKPGMCKGVRDYTKGRNTCTCINHWAGKVVSLLKSLSVAQDSWEYIVGHFITHKPPSLSEIDGIVTFGDNFPIQAQWIRCTAIIDAAEFAMVYFAVIVLNNMVSPTRLLVIKIHTCRICIQQGYTLILLSMPIWLGSRIHVMCSITLHGGPPAAQQNGAPGKHSMY